VNFNAEYKKNYTRKVKNITKKLIKEKLYDIIILYLAVKTNTI